MTRRYSSPEQVQEARVQGPMTRDILTTHDLGVEKVENMCHCLFFLLTLRNSDRGIGWAVPSWMESCYNWCAWVTSGLEGKLGSPPLLLSSRSPLWVLGSRSENSQGTCIVGVHCSKHGDRHGLKVTFVYRVWSGQHPSSVAGWEHDLSKSLERIISFISSICGHNCFQSQAALGRNGTALGRSSVGGGNGWGIISKSAGT